MSKRTLSPNGYMSSLNNSNWRKYFKIWFKTYRDPFHQWFQYRILHCILGTRKLLHTAGIPQSSLCLLCNSELIYFTCVQKSTISGNSWRKKTFTGFSIDLSPTTILLIYNDFIILVTNLYLQSLKKIFWASNIRLFLYLFYFFHPLYIEQK